MHHYDGQIGKLRSRIQLRKSRIVPIGDLSQEDVRNYVGGEFQFLVNARHVVCRHIGAQHSWKVVNLRLGLRQLLIVHRAVGGAKIHCARQHLADSAAAPDGLVIDLNLRMLLVVFAEPLGIDGIRKGRPRAVQRRLGKQGRRS